MCTALEGFRSCALGDLWYIVTSSLRVQVTSDFEKPTPIINNCMIQQTTPGKGVFQKV